MFNYLEKNEMNKKPWTSYIEVEGIAGRDKWESIYGGNHMPRDMWAPNQPDNSRGNETCTQVFRGGLNDVSCSAKDPVLCVHT